MSVSRHGFPPAYGKERGGGGEEEGRKGPGGPAAVFMRRWALPSRRPSDAPAGAYPRGGTSSPTSTTAGATPVCTSSRMSW